MSGGSLDYIQYKIEEAELNIRRAYPKDALIQAFCKHLVKVGEVLHDIEWEMSGDSSLGEKERQLIRDIVGKNAEKEYLIEDAKRIIKELQAVIKNERS